MKKLPVLGVLTFIIALIIACGGNTSTDNKTSEPTASTSSGGETNADAEKYDPKRGEGKFTSVELGPLDAKKVESGTALFKVKCAPCHKLTDERLVGPGWAGVTTRHTPEWIMNFITNPDAMIDVDPELQVQLEICLVRMPNQSLSDDDARNLLEYMRSNDGVK